MVKIPSQITLLAQQQHTLGPAAGLAIFQGE